MKERERERERERESIGKERAEPFEPLASSRQTRRLPSLPRRAPPVEQSTTVLDCR